MVARAPGKAILALPLLMFLVAVVLVLTARSVAAPSVAHILPIVVHTATTTHASSAPPAGHGSTSGSSSAVQPRPDTAPPASKVKTGGGTDRTSSCTSTHCPR